MSNVKCSPASIIRPAAWAVKLRNHDDDRDDPWADIACNPDTAKEDADAHEATSTDRFDVVPLYELSLKQLALLEKAEIDRAWNLRDLSKCRCDHNEYCDHCFPSEFR